MPITVRTEAGFKRAMDALSAEMRAASSTTRDATLKRVAAVDAIQNAETFAKERDPITGAAWPTLESENKGYAAWKRRNLPGRKMLVWNGRLRDSTRHASAEGRIEKWDGDVIKLGTRDPNAIKHQEGETYSPTRRIFLKEKTPVPRAPRQRKSRQRVSLGSIGGVARMGVLPGPMYTPVPRKWFTLWLDKLTPRPFIGKTPEQHARLVGVMAAEMIKGWSRVMNAAAGRRVLTSERLESTAAAGRLRVR